MSMAVYAPAYHFRPADCMESLGRLRDVSALRPGMARLTALLPGKKDNFESTFEYSAETAAES